MSGELVKTIEAANAQAVWNVKNEKNDNVASGIYIYIITNTSGEKKTGKIAIIR